MFLPRPVSNNQPRSHTPSPGIQISHEIKSRHLALNNLMKTSRDISGRLGILDAKVGSIRTLLESEVDLRQGLRRGIQDLVSYLGNLDAELSR